MAKNKPIRVKKWIRSGNDGQFDDKIKSQQQILEICGNALDSACTSEILGEVAFQATNGQYYVVTVEAVIGKANPDYIKDLLKEDAENNE